MIELSIVSPVYNAASILPHLVKQIKEAVEKISPDYEIILVDDGSPDESWQAIEKECNLNPRVKGVKLVRNFGQHFAITAALEASSGNFVVVMDCDLQDDPKYLNELYRKAKEGFEIVYTEKQERKHSFYKNITARIFNSVFNYLSENVQSHSNVGAYSLISRKVVDAFMQIKDSHRHYLMVLRWLGFRSTSIKIVHQKRHSGQSTYNVSKMLKHAIDGIVSHSDKLLRLSIGTGFIFVFVSFLSAAIVLVRYFLYGALPGYTSTTLLLLLSTGLILMSIGIAGIYIGKIFEQVKSRPLYLTEKKVNF